VCLTQKEEAYTIVTLSITEGKFINNPFILCFEWYSSWKKTILCQYFVFLGRSL